MLPRSWVTACLNRGGHFRTVTLNVRLQLADLTSERAFELADQIVGLGIPLDVAIGVLMLDRFEDVFLQDEHVVGVSLQGRHVFAGIVVGHKSKGLRLNYSLTTETCRVLDAAIRITGNYFHPLVFSGSPSPRTGKRRQAASGATPSPTHPA